MSQVLPADRGLRRIIGDGDGLPDGDVDGLGADELVALFRDLVLLRTYDERSVVYHRQGRIGTYAIFWNHEAMQVGAAFALVANCSPYTYAGSFALDLVPNASFDAGLAVLAPVELRGRDLPRLVLHALRGGGLEGRAETLYAHDLDRLVVRCDRPLPLQIDGEDAGDVAEVVYEAERDAVTILV